MKPLGLKGRARRCRRRPAASPNPQPLFFDDRDFIHQPCDFRHVGLHRTAGYILGVDPTEVPLCIVLDDDTRPLAEPYVCIVVQSTTQSKYWNNPNGWREIVAFLKAAGYRVVCIYQKLAHGQGLVWNHIPNGAEDETGDPPLQERARWLKHAEFFVGLSTGLCLPRLGGRHAGGDALRLHPPDQRVNWHACNSSEGRRAPPLRPQGFFLWCPRHKDTPRQFECTRLITAQQVKGLIRGVPGFGARAGGTESIGKQETCDGHRHLQPLESV